MQNKSIIGKQSVDVVYDGDVDPFVFRDELSWFCTSKLIPAIEKLFEGHSMPGKVICFESLSIDVGDLPVENWQSVFVDRVIEELSHYIGSTSASSHEQSASCGDDSGAMVQAYGNARKEIDVVTNRRETLFYFLKHGTLPWNSSIKSKQDLNALLLELIGEAQGLENVIRFVKNDKLCLQRLISQFESKLIDDVLIRYIKTDEIVFAELKGVVTALLRIDGATTHAREIVYTTIFSIIVDSRAKDFKECIESVVIQASRHERFARWIAEISKSADTPLTVQEIVLRELNIASITFGGSVERVVVEQIDKILSHELAMLPDHAVEKSIDRPKRVKEIDTQAESWFVGNAGLAILHPFFSMLFENVGYTENKKWLSVDTQYRAIMLMQFMVKGEGEYAEFDLMLNKIMTGYPLEDTLPGDLVLSEFEKHEAMDVLTSVIKHWTALKNTSVVGLQSEFLQREGKLFLESGSWNLKVEQKTSDILMSRLPWGISMIKTPWMKTMMQVEWT